MRIPVTLITLVSLLLTGCMSTVTTGTDVAAKQQPEKQTVEQSAEDQSGSADEADTESEPKPGPVYLPVRIERVLPNDVRDSYVVRTYDERTLELVTEAVYLSDERLLERTEIVRRQNEVIRETYDDNGDLAHVERRILEDGRIVRALRLNENRRLLSESRYEYDSQGRRINWSIYDEEGTLLSYTEYGYDGDRRVRADNYDREEELAEYRTWEYDDEGRLVSAVLRDAVDDSVLEEIEYSYDAAGLLTEIVRSSPGYYRRTVRAWDSRGNLSSETHYGRANTPLSTDNYTYDAFGPGAATENDPESGMGSERGDTE